MFKPEVFIAWIIGAIFLAFAARLIYSILKAPVVELRGGPPPPQIVGRHIGLKTTRSIQVGRPGNHKLFLVDRPELPRISSPRTPEKTREAC